ncbi:hypothetical protein [Xanthomonas dyei]|uniref:hypothetical protein n=1 Tax=Xanthomonas dyei TaxID=743699 RepID=UPI001E2CD399|nr:hypothetical protein [Xanthomonas dyei]MCC4635858.1 hypothetical protein [Xanthomonas dyei pv. eucalypti]
MQRRRRPALPQLNRTTDIAAARATPTTNMHNDNASITANFTTYAEDGKHTASGSPTATLAIAHCSTTINVRPEACLPSINATRENATNQTAMAV